MTDIIDDYDEQTVPEVKETLASADYTDAELGSVLDYEREHKDRVTLIDHLEELREDAPPARGGRPEHAVDVDTSEGYVERAETDHSRFDGARPEVTVTAASRGYHGGEWFDDERTPHRVVRTPRIDEAIKEGDLQCIDTHE